MAFSVCSPDTAIWVLHQTVIPAQIAAAGEGLARQWQQRYEDLDRRETALAAGRKTLGRRIRYWRERAQDAERKLQWLQHLDGQNRATAAALRRQLRDLQQAMQPLVGLREAIQKALQ